MGLGSASEAFIEVENILSAVNNLSDLGNKIRAIRPLKSELEKEIIILSQKRSNCITKMTVDNLLNVLDDLLLFLTNTNKSIIKDAKDTYTIISKCEYGQEENCAKNAIAFQQNVIFLLSWLFIEEIRLLADDEIDQEQLKRDGIFEIQDPFDFHKREIDKIRFSHILVECKNYRKPSYHDLMQVFSYTLLNKIYPLVSKPLCLLISRENPSKDSITLRMRDKLFEKEGDHFLLVLFLSCEDLSKMVELREKSGDPFLVLGNHIKKILRDSTTAEY